jgi:hypothetical protein
MTQQDDTAIRRRPDGSIDTDFYAGRAALLRRTAAREGPARWLRGLGGFVAGLAVAAWRAGAGTGLRVNMPTKRAGDRKVGQQC